MAARQRGVSVDSTNGRTMALQCEHAFGITATSNATFASHRQSGLLAYPAGCVVVVMDSKQGTQSRIVNTSKKEVVALAFSNDGKFLACGESGHKPSVRVWDVASGQLFAHFDGHDNAIPFVAFSADDKYLVSVGNQFDNTINLWNWRKRERISSTKNTAEVHGLVFPDGESSHFLTIGKGHAKIWYIEEEREGRFFLKGVVPNGAVAKRLFTGAVFGDSNHVAASYQKNICKFAVDVPKQPTNKPEKRWVLKAAEKSLDGVKHIFTMISDKIAGRIYAGCENGEIKVLDAKTLSEIGSLPKPHRLDNMLGKSQPNHEKTDQQDLFVHPHTTALSFLDSSCGELLLAVLYSDRSIYVWNVSDLKKVTKVTSWIFHSHRILGLDVYPNVDAGVLPPNSFATCSDDGTIRLWNAKTSKLVNVIYCTDLIAQHNNQVEPDSAGVANCIAFNPNGRELAAGFRNGSVKVYDLSNIAKDPVIVKTSEPASVGHSSSVLALEYSNFIMPGLQLLAAGGCDGYISVFNVANTYSLHQNMKTLQSSAINGLRFAASKTDAGHILLISSSQDKSLRLHKARLSPSSKMDSPEYLSKFDEGHQIVLPCSPHDIEINDQLIAVACHDRQMRIYDLSAATNEPLCSYPAAATNDGTLKRFSIDPVSKALVATICSDKTITVGWKVWETKVGKDRHHQNRVFASSSGHSEQMAGVKFLPDGQHFLTVAADGCIFSWKTPSTENLDQKLASMSRQSSGEKATSRTPSASDGHRSNSSTSSSASNPTTPAGEPKKFEATPEVVSEPVAVHDKKQASKTKPAKDGTKAAEPKKDRKTSESEKAHPKQPADEKKSAQKTAETVAAPPKQEGKPRKDSESTKQPESKVPSSKPEEPVPKPSVEKPAAETKPVLVEKKQEPVEVKETSKKQRKDSESSKKSEHKAEKKPVESQSSAVQPKTEEAKKPRNDSESAKPVEKKPIESAPSDVKPKPEDAKKPRKDSESAKQAEKKAVETSEGNESKKQRKDSESKKQPEKKPTETQPAKPEESKKPVEENKNLVENQLPQTPPKVESEPKEGKKPRKDSESGKKTSEKKKKEAEPKPSDDKVAEEKLNIKEPQSVPATPVQQAVVEPAPAIKPAEEKPVLPKESHEEKMKPEKIKKAERKPRKTSESGKNATAKDDEPVISPVASEKPAEQSSQPIVLPAVEVPIASPVEQSKPADAEVPAIVAPPTSIEDWPSLSPIQVEPIAAASFGSYAKMAAKTPSPEPENVVKTIAEVSLKQPTTPPKPKHKTAKLEVKPIHEQMDALAHELHSLNVRLGEELHGGATAEDSSMRSRILEAIEQVRRELDDCLEKALGRK